MISEIFNDIDFDDLICNIKRFLPFKQIRIIRRNNKKIKKVYYGNLYHFVLLPPFTLSLVRRLLK